jgi:penicillin-binding protein 1A
MKETPAGPGGIRRRVTAFPAHFQAFFRRYTFIALLVLTAVAGSMFGATVAYQSSLTEEARQVRALAAYRPSVVTKVYASDGRTVIGEFAMERRIPLTYDEIPDQMRSAIMAIEDSRFYKHIGVDPLGIARAGVKNLQAGETVEGGSTLTQQLTKILFLSPERTFTRKIKEALIALQIERLYSKEQILELYCNQIFLGGGAYGVEAGAQYYFSKSIKDCALEECAMLAALPKAPSAYSPVLNPKRALERRNLVLFNMREEGFIDEALYRETIAKPIKLNVTSNSNKVSPNDSEFGYAVEEVRQAMEQKYGTRTTQTEGLRIFTTIDTSAQREAVRAIRRGLHAYEARHGKRWRGDQPNISTEFKDLGRYWHHDWDDEPVPNEHIFGLVMASSGDTASVRFGNYTAKLTAAECKIAGAAPGKILKPGDVTPFKIEKIDKENKTITAQLAQVPAVAGALVCIEAKTGAVRAMVGGYDFALTKFNNATQAERQTGSVFKPFIYTAAMERGFTPDTVVSGAPVSVGSWTPHNYDGSTSCGPMPLRQALAKSLNVPAVNTLKQIGVDAGADAVRRFGLPNPMKRVLPAALGATEEPLLNMVSAYSTFPNQGQRSEPYLIARVEDRDGVVKEDWQAVTHKVTSGYVAANMVEVMRGVVDAGTATAIKGSRELGKRPIAGKTGTVNDFTDAWFIGYTPSYASGVWIGYPGSKRSLGEKETGGQAALPMWIDFMEDFLKGTPVEKFPERPAPDPAVLAEQARIAREAAIARQQASSAAAADTMADDVKEGAGTRPQPQPVYVDIPDRLRDKQPSGSDDSKAREDEQKKEKKKKEEKEKKEKKEREQREEENRAKRGKNG